MAQAQDPAGLSQYQSADALWLHLQDVKKGPPTRPASAAEYQMVMTSMVTQLYTGATEFIRRYPDDPRAWDARLMVIETAASLNREAGARMNPR